MASYRGTYFLVSGWRGSDGKWTMANVPVYRLYNPFAGYHMYTTSYAEYTGMVSDGWRGEGIIFFTDGSGDVPLFRLYNQYNGMHLFTTSKSEYDGLVSAGWTGEGVAMSLDSTGNFDVYRLYNQYTGEHLYTPSASERDGLAARGWTAEGTAFRAYALVALDTASDSTADGTDVRLGAFSYARSQAWAMDARADGSQRLMNLQTGRCLAVAGSAVTTAGADVWQWHDDGSEGLRWAVTPTGSKATIGGTECELVTLSPSSGASMGVAASSGAVGADVRLAAIQASSALQQWALLPMPAVRSRGLYELRLMADTGLALDVAGASAADGADVMVHPANGGNNQKFWLEDEGDGWSLRAVHSGKYVDVAGGSIGDGANVQQWRDNDTRAQRWLLTATGTTWLGGGSRQVVTLGAADSDGLLLTATAASADASAYVEAAAASDTQRWALLPTVGVDGSVPVPTDVCLSSAVGRHEGGDRAYQARCYPSWRCADGFVRGGNHYQCRWRRRYLRTSTSTWTPWEGWNEWAERPSYESGGVTWLSDGVDTSYAVADAKSMQVEFQVRAAAADGGGLLVGGAADAVHSVSFVPSMSFETAAGVTPEALELRVSSDYPGTSALYVQEVRVNGANVLYEGFDAGAVTQSPRLVEVPLRRLSREPADGDSVEVVYQVGNDVVSRWTWRTWSSGALRAAYSAGNEAVSPTIEAGPGRTLRVGVPSLGGRASVWWRGAGGALAAAHEGESGGVDWWSIEYPMGAGFGVVYEAVSADGSRWALGSVAIAATDPRLGGPCHALSWDAAGGGRRSLLVEWVEKSGYGSRDMQPGSATATLSGRDRPAVTFDGVTKATWDVDGYLLPGGDAGDVDDLVDAVERAHYVTYRSPRGEVARCAVTRASYKYDRLRAKVSIDLTEVGTDG